MRLLKFLSTLSLIVGVSSIAAAQDDASSSDRPARVLFVTQSAGFAHSTVTRKEHELSHTERIMKQLGIESGEFRVDCTQDVASDFTPEALENYDVVMFYTTGKLPIPAETLDWFLNDWLKQPGHAFLGVHSATDTYKEHAPFYEMIGGTFDGHPWRANGTVTVAVHEEDHPAAAPWAAIADGQGGFQITDEIYKHKNFVPENVRVLMSLDMARTKLKKPYHVPVLWVKSWGEGCVMHMSLGHREDVWTHPTYQESLIGGIRWLIGKDEGSSEPNPELSAKEEQKAREAAQPSTTTKEAA